MKRKTFELTKLQNGTKINDWTIVDSYATSDYKGVYILQCSCGKQTSYVSDYINYGKIPQNCGHDKFNIIGKKFGSLTVEKIIETEPYHHFCICRCECGKIKRYKFKSVTSGKITNCGCKDLGKLDLTGQKFGKLTALNVVGKDNHNCKIWLCKCDCGNLREVRNYELARHRITTCKQCKSSPYNKTDRKNTERLQVMFNKIKKNCTWNNGLDFYDWALNNGYSKSKILKRKDKSLPYSEDNAIWVDKETYINEDTYIIHTTKYGTTTLYGLSKISGISYKTLRARYKNGLRGDEILQNQVRGKLSQKKYKNLQKSLDNM